MKKISDKKLNAPFENFNALDINYVKLAREISEEILKGNEPDPEKVAKIRLLSCYDKTHLKGDFVISMYSSILKEVREEAEFTPWRGGKRLRANEKLLRKVYINHFTKELSVTEFCRKHRITRSKYYRIVNCDVKLENDKKYLGNLKTSIQMLYEN